MARGWTTFTACSSPLEGEFAEREAENAPEVDVDLSEDDAELEADETAHYPTIKKPLQIAVIGRPERRASPR
jgi:GTPase